MIGPNMNQHTTQVKRIANEGHGLALHGMTHRKEKFYASPAAALGEMDNDNAILKKITGQSTTLIVLLMEANLISQRPLEIKCWLKVIICGIGTWTLRIGNTRMLVRRSIIRL